MELRPNRLKSALRAGEAQIGLWLALADGYSAEICAGAGFDWLLIDGEHAPNDLRSTLHQLQTAAAYPVQLVVRPAVGETHIIKQLLDIGAQTLLIPMVETVEQVQRLVAAMRYPPQGVRGVGSALARASHWNSVPDYLHRAAEELCLVLQIESVAGLSQLAAIAALDGVDGIFLGPSDLAASMGYLGNPTHPEVREAIQNAIGTIVAARKFAGILSTQEDEAKFWLSLGCTFVAVGSDTTLLARSARQLALRFKSGPMHTTAKSAGGY